MPRFRRFETVAQAMSFYLQLRNQGVQAWMGLDRKPECGVDLLRHRKVVHWCEEGSEQEAVSA